MSKKVLIKKAFGDRELFSADKLRKSMLDSGASRNIIDDVILKIKQKIKPGTTTNQIHSMAFQMLKQANKSYAARYNLKRAIMELGPDGFPFEQYFADLMRSSGYSVQTNVVVNGRCITHEVDAIVEDDKKGVHAIVEAKFHGHAGRKTGSKDALYTYGRFLDIQNEWNDQKKLGAKPKGAKLQSWLVTNTEMTTNAINYCNCVGIKMIAWSYPQGSESLQGLVHNTGLYPVTTLASLNKQDKRKLIQKGVIMCKDLLGNRSILKKIGLTDRQTANVLEEVQDLCG